MISSAAEAEGDCGSVLAGCVVMSSLPLMASVRLSVWHSGMDVEVSSQPEWSWKLRQ